jgi:acetylornithine deacetylase
VSDANAVSPSPLRPESRAWIERLIAFDTTSRNSNLELIEDVRGYLASLGVEATLVYNEERSKANLYATIGPADRPGIALSGHTDVVPVDGQDWSSDPWKVEERDGKLYGRGTSDMKGFIALVLAHLPDFLARELSTPIHLCFSYDEEVGCLGVRPLLDFLRSQPVKPRLALIGEPTSMQVITAHKGKLSQRCRVVGSEAHSSLAPYAVNAVQEAAKLVTYIAALAEEKEKEGPFDEAFDVPHTTVHTGVIQGGQALNIVPRDCFFDFEFRSLPGEDPALLLRRVMDYAHKELEPAMQAKVAGTGFSWEEISAFPALDTPPDAEVVELAKSLTGSNSTAKVAFGTEAGLFSESGISCVVCGPGSIEQAHKPDEWVEIDQLATCERFLERLLNRVSA